MAKKNGGSSVAKPDSQFNSDDQNRIRRQRKDQQRNQPAKGLQSSGNLSSLLFYKSMANASAAANADKSAQNASAAARIARTTRSTV